MWNVEPKVIPVVVGATGTISKSFRTYVKSMNSRKQPYWALYTYFGKY